MKNTTKMLNVIIAILFCIPVLILLSSNASSNIKIILTIFITIVGYIMIKINKEIQ